MLWPYVAAWAILGTLVLAVVVASDARSRGVSPALWFVLTAVLSVFGALAYLVMRPAFRLDEESPLVDTAEEPVSISSAAPANPTGRWESPREREPIPPPLPPREREPFTVPVRDHEPAAIPPRSIYEQEFEPDEPAPPRRNTNRVWLYVGALVFMGLVVAGAIAAYIATPGTAADPNRRPTVVASPTAVALPTPTEVTPIFAPTATTQAETPAAAAPPPPTSTAGSTAEVYSVQAGDTLLSIAERYGVSVEELQQANNISGETIFEGQQLRIPERSP